MFQKKKCKNVPKRCGRKSIRSLEEIEDELDNLQLAYLEEEDEARQMALVSSFTRALQEATAVDHRDRVAANVTIHNWVRETVRYE